MSTIRTDYAIESQRITNLLDCIRGNQSAISGHDAWISEEHVALFRDIADCLVACNDELVGFRHSLDDQVAEARKLANKLKGT